MKFLFSSVNNVLTLDDSHKKVVLLHRTITSKLAICCLTQISVCLTKSLFGFGNHLIKLRITYFVNFLF